MEVEILYAGQLPQIREKYPLITEDLAQFHQDYVKFKSSAEMEMFSLQSKGYSEALDFMDAKVREYRLNGHEIYLRGNDILNGYLSVRKVDQESEEDIGTYIDKLMIPRREAIDCLVRSANESIKIYISMSDRLRKNFCDNNLDRIKENILLRIANRGNPIGPRNSRILQDAGLSPGLLDQLLFKHFDNGADQFLASYGMAWSDAAIKSTTTMTWEPSGRFAFGLDITADTLAIQGVGLILRAHQHHGEMAELLEKHHIVVLWDFDNLPKKFALRPNKRDIITFQVARSSGMRHEIHDDDPFGLLTIGKGDLATCTLEKILMTNAEKAPNRRL